MLNLLIFPYYTISTAAFFDICPMIVLCGKGLQLFYKRALFVKVNHFGFVRQNIRGFADCCR